MSSSSIIKWLIFTLIANIVILYVYLQYSYPSQYEAAVSNEIPSIISTAMDEIVQEKPTESSDNADIIATNEDKIAQLKAQLEISEANVKKFKEAKDQVSENAKSLRGDFEIIYARSVAQKDTLKYITKVIQNINPLRKLGLYEKMPAEYYNGSPDGKFIPNTHFYALKHNPGYCDAVDLYNLQNPENVFEKMNFITDYGLDEALIRLEIMRKQGHDVMPNVWLGEEDHKALKFDLAVDGTMLFFKRNLVHRVYAMNQEWACLSQMYNHIPGSGVLTRKDLLVETINNYTSQYKNRPECIRNDKFFPHAFRLDIQSECQDFFKIINSPKFEQNKEHDPIQYLIKQGYGAHRAAGVFLMDDKFEKEIRVSYNNGELCGAVKKPYVAQRYISNPLLLDKKNKFDFRIYMLVASVDPLIVYYHDGFLRVSLSEYDKFSKEKNVHFTNTHLSKEIFEKAQEEDAVNGMDEEQLRDYQMWTMEDLEAYLLESGKIQDKNWLENYLKPKFKEAFVHISRMAENSFYKSPSVFEMYGLDFVMDEDLNIWLIECNASPQLVGTNEKKTDFIIKMITDLFEIEYSYLRSRMKRVHSFVHEMERMAQMGAEMDYEKLKNDFNKVKANRLEPEFQINANSSFVRIVDKNLEGHAAYFGNVAEKCI